jgi:threonyl-tRNA synthetase
VPYQIVIGNREQQERKVTARTQQGENLGTFSLEELLAQLNQEIKRYTGGNKH